MNDNDNVDGANDSSLSSYCLKLNLIPWYESKCGYLSPVLLGISFLAPF